MAACSKCDSGYARVQSQTEARLASFVTARDRRCGTVTCPWLIEVEPGRTINVTVVDFFPVGLPSSTSSAAGSGSSVGRLAPSWGSAEAQCPSSDRYAVVKERANPKEAVVCGGNSGGGGGGARRHVYTSISNKIEIKFESSENMLDRPFFIEFRGWL